MNISAESGAAEGRFLTTRWTVVLASVETDAPHADEALAALCRAYWMPLYCFVRRRGHGVHEAQDLVQAFFLHLLEKDVISGADRRRGRFRSYLLAALENFLANAHDHASAHKRGGGRGFVSLDACDIEELERVAPADRSSPESVFDLRWAEAVLARAFARLRGEAAAREGEQLFDHLKVFLVGDAPGGDGTAASLEAAAERQGVALTALKSAVHRLRQRFRTLLREEVSLTVDSPLDVDGELQFLRATLSRLPGGMSAADGSGR